MLIIDGIYLKLIGGPPFMRMVAKIQGSEPSVRRLSAFIVYLIMIHLLDSFILTEGRSISDAFKLGFLTYGVFDFTNYALFKDYRFWIALQDSIWGGILFASVTYLFRIV